MTQRKRSVMKRRSRWSHQSNSFSNCIPGVPLQRRSYTLIFRQRVLTPLHCDCIEETLHIAVNTPQLLEVPKKLRPAVLQLLREQLQEYVMGQLSDTTDDVELMSHRQVEANQFRSRVLREVSEILEAETKKETTSYANGFAYRVQRGRRRVFSEVDPFDETTAKPSFEEPESFLSESQRQYEEKRMKLNRDFFDSLQSGKKREVVASDSEESDNVYCNLSELMKDNDPSIRRYDFGLENELMQDPVLSEWFFGGDEEKGSVWGNGGVTTVMDSENGVVLNRENGVGLDSENKVGLNSENGVSVKMNTLSDKEKEEKKSEGKEVFSLVDDSSHVPQEEMKVPKRIESFGEEADQSVNESTLVSPNELDGVDSVVDTNHTNSVDAHIGSINATTSINSTFTNSTPIRGDTEESDEDAVVVCTSSDGSIRVSHSSSFWRENKPSSKPLVTSFTEAVHTDPIDERRKEEEEAKKALFSRLVNSNQNALHERKQDLLKKYRHFSSQNAFVSEDIIVDTTEILRIFGIPFLFAPGEAEAQCAFLEMMGLVDGVISNDSDVFAFGGKHLYRNFFVDNQYVQAYRIEDMEHELGLSRERIIEFALLEGCDYCDVRELLHFQS